MRFLPRLSRSPHTTLHTQARRGAQANPNKRAKAAQLPQNAKRFSASSHAALHGLDEEEDAQPASSELPPANSIVTLVENRKYEVGIASLSTDDYTVQIGQFCDDQAYSKTLALMTRYEPRIIVFPEWLPSEPNGTVLERICRNEYASARIEHLPRKYWQDVKGMQHARHFSPRSELSALETDISSKYLCLSALAAIIDYAEYQAKMAFVKGTLRIRFSSVEGIMLLDPATVANLELLRNVRTGDTKTSLFGVLNHCKTGAGSRMLRAALIQPSTDMDTITARHDCVVELIAREDALVDLQKILPTLADCDRMLKLFIERQNISDSAARSEACISAVLQLKQVLHTVPCLAAALSENDQRPPKNELLQKVQRLPPSPSRAAWFSLPPLSPQPPSTCLALPASPIPTTSLDLPRSPCLPSPTASVDLCLWFSLPPLSTRPTPPPLLAHLFAHSTSSLTARPNPRPTGAAELARTRAGPTAAVDRRDRRGRRRLRPPLLAAAAAVPLLSQAWRQDDTRPVQADAGRVDAGDGTPARELPRRTLAHRAAPQLQPAARLPLRAARVAAPARRGERLHPDAGDLVEEEYLVHHRAALAAQPTLPRDGNPNPNPSPNPTPNPNPSPNPNQIGQILLTTEKEMAGLVEKIQQQVHVLFQVSESVALLDMMVAFGAHVKLAGGDWARPRMDGTASASLVLKQARHPILDRFGEHSLVANDVYATPASNFALITGPNMAGKSTYLRMTALVCLMAHVGCLVPASQANVPLLSRVFTRIASSDCLESCTSTFAGEMRETTYIVRNLGPSALVLVDELGRGTSNRDGASLAWAVAEELLNAPRTFTFFATHYLHLANLKNLYPNVRTLMMWCVSEAVHVT